MSFWGRRLRTHLDVSSCCGATYISPHPVVALFFDENGHNQQIPKRSHAFAAFDTIASEATVLGHWQAECLKHGKDAVNV